MEENIYKWSLYCDAVVKISVKGERKGEKYRETQSVFFQALARECSGSHCRCTSYMTIQGTETWWLCEEVLCV